MKRRMFVASGSTFLLGSSAKLSTIGEPAVGVEFSILDVTEADPSNTQSVVISFEKLELTPFYVNEQEAFDVSIRINIDGNTETRNTSVQLENSVTSDISSDPNLNTIEVDGIGKPEEEFIIGDITVSVKHPDIKESYSRSFTISRDTVIPNGLIAHWTMANIDSNDNIIDETDNNNDASKVGSPNYSVVNGPVYDDAVYYYADSTGQDGWDAGDSSVWNNLDSVSFSLWFKSDYAGRNMIAGNGGGWESSGFMIFQLDESNIRWEQQDGSKINIDWEGFPKDEWVHVVGTWDGSEMIIYGNGDDKSRSDYSGQHSGDHNFGLGLNVLDEVGDGPAYDMRGALQDVRIYDRALSPSEVQKLYELGQ